MGTTAPLSVGMLTGSVSRAAGGLFHSVRQGAFAVRHCGINVAVYGVHDAHTDEDLREWSPLSVTVAPRVGPQTLAFAPKLPGLIDPGDHSVLHLHGIWQYPSYVATRWRQRPGRSVVVSPRGMLDPWAVQNSGLKKKVAGALFENANLRGAACLHALCRSEADAMRGFGLTNPIAVVPNGTSLPDPAAKQRAATPAPWTSDSRKVMIFLGRIHPKKGVAETLKAWAKMKATAPDLAQSWRLVVAGWDDGGHLPGLERLADELGLAKDVTFPGPLFGDEKAAALTHADGFLLASYSEGLPMAILESWAYGLPVFMSDGCNLPEGFEAEAAIRLATDPDEQAAALRSALPRADLPAFGQRGRELVAQRFTWPVIGQQMAALYRWIAGQGPQPDFVETV